MRLSHGSDMATCTARASQLGAHKYLSEAPEVNKRRPHLRKAGQQYRGQGRRVLLALAADAAVAAQQRLLVVLRLTCARSQAAQLPR